MRVDLHAHQEEAVEKLHNGCILYGGVGVGKTITSLAYYFSRVCGGEINKWGSMRTPKDVYVITTAKVRDSKAFELQAAHFGVHEDPAISTNGVKITVDSWNNLHKYVEVKDAFFIFDEQRVVGYGAWSRAFIKVAKHNEWILLSATPGDTWLDYIPVFIANGWYKHKTDFLDQHVIWMPRVKYPKVLRYQNVGLLVRRRNQVLVHMPFERHTVRHPVDIWCEYDEELFDKAVKRRWHVYEKRPLRDAAELFIVMRKVVNSDTSRLEAVSSLLQKHPKLIVFYNFDYELEMLRTLQPPTSERSPTPKRRTKGSKSSSPSTTEALHSRGRTTSEMEDWEWLTSKEGLTTQSELLSSRSKGSTASSKGSSTSNYPQSSEAGSEQTGTLSVAEKRIEEWQTSTTSDSTQYSAGPHSSESSRLVQPNSKGCANSESLEELKDDVSNILSSTSTSETPSVSATNESQTFTIAEWNGHKHQEIPTTDRWLYLVQYRAGAEGWNCVETDAICFYSQTYSYRDWWQAHGRIDRLNTMFTDLYYYHLISRSVIDKAIRKALKAKKSFNERDLAL